MIELVFVTCLAAAPIECRQRHLQFVDVSLMQCVMGAQPQLAQWANHNPKWKIVQWSCEQPRTAELKA